MMIHYDIVLGISSLAKLPEAFNFLIAACRQLSRSVQGIFGPSDPLLGAHIQSICEALDVPHLEARVDFEPTFKEFSINLYPAQDHLNKAFKDLMSFLNWTRVAIIYEEDYGKPVAGKNNIAYVRIAASISRDATRPDIVLILTKDSTISHPRLEANLIVL